MLFWKQHILEAIGNKIGKSINLEDDWENKVDRRCTRILVELDVREGLFEEIIIKMHGRIWIQRIDY